MSYNARMRKFLAVLTAYVVLGGVSGLAGSQRVAAADAVPATSADCNRHCLLGILTTYTEALVDNDTSRLAVSPQLRVTSNGAVTTLGHGQVWGAVKRIPYRHAFVDPVSGAAVFYGTLTNTPTRDAEKWWFYVVRLKIVGQQLSEIEEISYDGMLGGTPASSLDLPHTIYDTYLPLSRTLDACAAVRDCRQILRCGDGIPQLSRRSVAPGVPAHRAGDLYGELEARPGQLRRGVQGSESALDGA